MIKIFFPVLSFKKNFSTRFLSLLLIITFLVSACGWFKKAPRDDKVYDDKEQLEEIKGQKVYNPETGKYEYVKDLSEPMDTVKWTTLPEEDFPPIRSEDRPGMPTTPAPGDVKIPKSSEKKASYNVTILLPFLSQNFDPFAEEIYENSLWAINYYAGMKMAFNRLQQEGLNLNVSVFDSKASLSKVKSLLSENEEFKNADLIIGPYRRDNVALVAAYAKKNHIAYVSPYSASSDLSLKNPFYIQVNPPLRNHCVAITRHVRKNYKPSQVILVARNSHRETARFQYFHDANAQIEGQRDSNRFRELIIEDGLTDFSPEQLKPFIKQESTTVFILPSWSSEAFISNFLRTLDLARADSKVVVYGMPQWMDYQNIDYDYYQKLNVHLSSATFKDDSSPEVKHFKQNYFDRFNTIPREEAYLGFDNMLYFGRMLKKYGNRFQPALEAEPYDGILMNYQIVPIVIPTAFGAEKKPIIDQYENEAIFILKFENFLFQPVD